MKHTEIMFDAVKVGDTLYIEGTGTEYGKCNKRTCVVVGIYTPDILCVDFGAGFCGHSAYDFVEGDTGYNLWKQDQADFILFKVEEEVPETKYTYSGKVLKHLKVGDIFLLCNYVGNNHLVGSFFEVILKHDRELGFTMKYASTDPDSAVFEVTHGSIIRGLITIQTVAPLGKTKEDKIAKLEAKLERITNKLKALKESGE